jgi:uncharacterized membrane protein (GlpM family)
MQVLIKAIISGIFIGIILWLSETRFRYLAGLLIFFPIISLPTFFFMGLAGEPEKMRETILWSIWSIPVWIAFAITLYGCSFRFKIIPSILLALGAWIIAASVLLWIKK